MRWLPGTRILTWVDATALPDQRTRSKAVGERNRRACGARGPSAVASNAMAEPVGGRRHPLDVDLARLVGDEQAGEAARSRARERWLRQQATAEATLVGLLVDLAEEGADVTVRTTSGRAHQGPIVAVGRDFVIVGVSRGHVCITLDALATARRRPGRHRSETTGDRPAPRSLTLADHLAALAPEAPRVSLAAAGEPVLLTGELRSVGRDVMTVRLDGEPPVTAYVALRSVSEVLVSG